MVGVLVQKWDKVLCGITVTFLASVLWSTTALGRYQIAVRGDKGVCVINLPNVIT